MSAIIEKFIRLKQAQPGNREKTGFEYSFGMPREELNRITPMHPHVLRILSQIEFAIHLSQAEGGAYEGHIEAAIDALQADMEREGCLTRQAAERAEASLDALREPAKAYTVLCAAHAHIDMNWMWGWHETVAATLDTFRTMLQLMEEYPEFTYSQSQASVYKIVEDFDPDMMTRIRQRVEEGRWEITASTWVENDKNMPCTEALVRHNLYTKQYLREHWGVSPDSLRIDFAPDTFGHGRDMPEIAAAAGVRYCYHCRAFDGPAYLYRWRARSGKELLMYREPYWYNSGILPHVGIGAPDICATYGMKTALIVYGVGNHGGGPTRRNIEQVLEMNRWPVFPRIRFGTFGEFFEAAEAVRGTLPVVEQELNHFAPGCFSTQSRIKLGNRQGEALLKSAEAQAAIARTLTGSAYRSRAFERAWQNVLFTHFHDILTGSCVQETREHAMGLYQEAFAVANTERGNAMRAIAERIDTSAIAEEGCVARAQSEGAGVGHGLAQFRVPTGYRAAGLTHVFHVFNPAAFAQRQVVELTVWDWQGDMARIEFTDGEGQVVRHQLLDSEYQRYWDHQYFRVLIDARLPAMGYDTYVLRQRAAEAYPVFRHPDRRCSYPLDRPVVLENAQLRATFDSKHLRLLSLIEKQSGREMIDPEKGAGFRFIEEDPAQSSAWTIGRYVQVDPLHRNVRVKSVTVGEGLLRQCIEYEQLIRGESKMTVRLWLDDCQAALVYDVSVDWHEIGTDKRLVPQLNFAAALPQGTAGYHFDTPGGVLSRKPEAIDVAANSFAAALPAQGKGLLLTSNCKYGFRAYEDTLALTLIHAPASPDPYPERGIHSIRLVLAVTDPTPKAMVDLAFSLNCLPAALTRRPAKGTLPQRAEHLRLDSEGIVLTGCKAEEQGEGVILRLHEIAGTGGDAVIQLPKPAVSAELVDTLEQPDTASTAKVSVEGPELRVHLDAHALQAVLIKF